jgi:polyhydroxyalkanoate synthesis regulator protein
MKELTIKRHNNRKMYIIEFSKYVTFLEIAGLIRQGHTIKVLTQDMVDITKKTLVGALRALEDDMPKYNEETLLEMIESY